MNDRRRRPGGAWILLVAAGLVTSWSASFSDGFQPCRSTPLLGRRRISLSPVDYDDGFDPIPPNGASKQRATSNRWLTKKPSNQSPSDSLQQLATDLTYVLRDLRAEPVDPSLPALFRPRDGRPTFCRTWTDKDWEIHSSRWRYWDYVHTLPRSRLMRRVWPHLSLLTLWSLLVATLAKGRWALPSHVPVTTLSLLSTFVAALLTLRSNQGLARLNEARLTVGFAVQYTRDIAQQVATTVYPAHPVLALKLARHLSVFGWLLKNFVRVSDAKRDEGLIRSMLDPEDADYVLRHRKVPVAVILRLRQILHHLTQEGKLSTANQLFFDRTIQKLNLCVTTVERIKASPIPPLYTAHTGRLLLCYLACLPLALVGTLDRAWALVVTVMVTGYTMLGLDEISHLLEQPFRLMPLYDLAKNSMKDVGDAFCCVPPQLHLDGAKKEETAALPTLQPYWDEGDLQRVAANCELP